jgi:pSer/pThr/pTyr-binding forkhead associated (FHA) protein
LPPILPSSGSRLVGLDGPYAAQVFALDMASVTLLTIGRSPENAVSLSADSAVSRMHAHIVAEGGAHVVYDDGSSNGTFVNNVRIGTQALAPGDIVQFGSSRFRYE